MAEPLKTFFSSDLVRRLARDIARVHPGFRVRAFTSSAVKRGDANALGLIGYGQTPRVSVGAVAFTPWRVRIGGRVAMTFGLKSTSPRRQQLLVDVAVHFVKARGRGAPKVFKLGRIALGPRERVDLKTTFSLAVHTTRVPRPGRHAVDVVVNGRAIRAGSFNVSPP